MLDAIYGTETLSPLARFNLDAFRNWFSACTFGLLEFGRLAGGLLLFIPFSRMLEESSGWVSCISPAFRSLNHNAIVWIMCWWCECYSFYLENCELEGSCSVRSARTAAHERPRRLLAVGLLLAVSGSASHEEVPLSLRLNRAGERVCCTHSVYLIERFVTEGFWPQCYTGRHTHGH